MGIKQYLWNCCHFNVFSKFLLICVTLDQTIFSVLSQWAEVMHVYQPTGTASVLGSTRSSHCEPHTITARQGMVLPKRWCTRHIVHIRMVTRTSQVLIFAAFKHHTIKKILGNTLRVRERIRKMFGQVMISEAQMHQSDHSPIKIPTE